MITKDAYNRQRCCNELDFLEAVLNGLPGILYLLSEEGQILRWNSRLETVSQYSREAIGQMAACEFFPPEKAVGVCSPPSNLSSWA